MIAIHIIYLIIIKGRKKGFVLNIYLYFKVSPYFKCKLYLIRGRRKWRPTPGLLPREPQGQKNLVGCHVWGHTESDTTEVT